MAMLKKNTVRIILFSISLSFFFWGCEEQLITEEYTNTPKGNFDAFWNEFDRFYGAFEVKKINWDSLKEVYSENISDTSTSKQLFGAMCGLLNELNDGHADLFSAELGYYRSWNRRNKPFFSDSRTNDWKNVAYMQNTIKTTYLKGKYTSEDYSGSIFFWGTIPYNGKSVGYICIPTFNLSDYPNQFIQTAIDSFNHLDAVIIDLRFNGGGKTEAFVSSLNSFASEKVLYLKSQFRDGARHTDFTKMDDHWVMPHTNCLKNKPIAILQNSYSASSSDHFILGMKSQPNVITVGDTTCGAFSAVLERVLPNGWKFRLGAQVVYSPTGTPLSDSNGNYLEGIGLAPDFFVADKWRSIQKGIDQPLNKALDVLRKQLE